MKSILFCVKELNSFTSHPSFFLSPIVSLGLRENYLFCSLSCLVETNEKKISQPECQRGFVYTTGKKGHTAENEHETVGGKRANIKLRIISCQKKK